MVRRNRRSDKRRTHGGQLIAPQAQYSCARTLLPQLRYGDDMDTTATLPATLPATLQLGAAQFTVRDLERATAWYERALGLSATIDDTARTATLASTDGPAVLELVERGDAVPAGHHAGLYHVALLLPDRAELARMVRRIALTRTPIQGASDHGTHEALYLTDADGIGLELAVDRPRAAWPVWSQDDAASFAIQPLDVDDLLATIDTEAVDMERRARGVRMGHIHLQVGDAAAQRAFHVDLIGFEPQFDLGTATFVSAGGYHHHLAWNTWRGTNLLPQPADVVGMRSWSFALPSRRDVDDIAERLVAAGIENTRGNDGSLTVTDPAGLVLKIHAQAEPETSEPEAQAQPKP